MQEPPLPTWKADDRKAYEEAGGPLQSLMLTVDPEPEPKPPLEVEKPKAEELTSDPVRSSEIPEKYLAAYFANKPTEFVVDPQGLLSAKDRNDRINFLKYHSGDSSIDFYIYVFGGEQEIPGEVRAEETVERLFSTGRPAAVVFYFLGAPQRSEIHLSPSLTEVVSAAEQRRALQSSVMAAFEKLNVAGQLEAFCVQMSIRIYWMERMIMGEKVPENPSVPLHKKAAAKKPESETMSAVKAEARRIFDDWWGIGSLALGTLMLSSAFIAWARARVRCRFPELEVEPRMGASHAAGVGAVISFSPAALPPASQKDQVPDYLRRA
jgi:hypothetical protein